MRRRRTLFSAAALLAFAWPTFASESLFDGRSWKVGYDASDAQQRITEYVVAPDTIDSWSELVTRQLVFDADHQISLPRLLELMRAGFGSDCRNFKWTVLRDTPLDILYEWSHDGCSGYPPQYEVSRLSWCQEGVCRWAYSTKLVPSTDALRSRWRQILDALEPGQLP